MLVAFWEAVEEERKDGEGDRSFIQETVVEWIGSKLCSDFRQLGRNDNVER